MTTPFQPGYAALGTQAFPAFPPETHTPTSPYQRVLAAPTGPIALINGTQNLLSWTAPNDGTPHLAWALVSLNITVTEVGGAIVVAYTPPTGSATTNSLSTGGQAGPATQQPSAQQLVAPGTTVTIQQSSALTGGTATATCMIVGV